MDRSMDSQLEDLKKMILVMGSHVEKALYQVTEGLLSGDRSLFDGVHAIEKTVNEDHIKIDSFCVNLLASFL